MKRNNKGFTLVELMIVVAIIAILSTVAYPSYTEYTKRVHRTGAQNALNAFGIAMEKVRLEEQEYRQANGTRTTDITASTVPVAALFFAQAPLDGSNKTYNLTIQSAKINSFILRATPIATGMMVGDGYLEFHSSGRKGWDQDNSATIGANEWCWATSKKPC